MIVEMSLSAVTIMPIYQFSFPISLHTLWQKSTKTFDSPDKCQNDKRRKLSTYLSLYFSSIDVSYLQFTQFCCSSSGMDTNYFCLFLIQMKPEQNFCSWLHSDMYYHSIKVNESTALSSLVYKKGQTSKPSNYN